MKMHVVGSELFQADGQAGRQTDGQKDMIKLMVTFCSFAKMTNIRIC
jgi:hypothetical protein